MVGHPGGTLQFGIAAARGHQRPAPVGQTSMTVWRSTRRSALRSGPVSPWRWWEKISPDRMQPIFLRLPPNVEIRAGARLRF